MPGEPLQRSPANGRLSHAVRRAIEDYIVDHRLRAGDPLPPEGQLALTLGVSRTSVHEAVKAMESLGIIEARTGAGLFIQPFSFGPILENLRYSLLADRHGIVELMDVRGKLEAGFIEQVAASVDPKRLRVLRSSVDRMGERAAGGEALADEDRFSHRTLYLEIDNQVLGKLIDVFWEVHRRRRAEIPAASDSDRVRSWEEHRQIVEALERRDGPTAHAAMVAHFAGHKARPRAFDAGPSRSPGAGSAQGSDGARGAQGVGAAQPAPRQTNSSRRTQADR